jgi:type II secretory pathway pseudopilin PulG
MNRQSGYALIVILLLLAMVLISLSVAIPPVLTQAKREKEEELIFRGQQYQRAIGRFFKKFGRYPTKTEELLRTNDRSFLRRPFRDPMMPDGQWRIIRMGPAGQLIGSKTVKQTPAKPAEEQKSRRGMFAGRRPERKASKGSEASDGSENGGASAGSAGVGAPIVGVGSNSQESSFRVYEGYSRYDHWEFIYDPSKQATGLPAGASPASGGVLGDKYKAKPKATN